MNFFWNTLLSLYHNMSKDCEQGLKYGAILIFMPHIDIVDTTRHDQDKNDIASSDTKNVQLVLIPMPRFQTLIVKLRSTEGNSSCHHLASMA